MKSTLYTVLDLALALRESTTLVNCCHWVVLVEFTIGYVLLSRPKLTAVCEFPVRSFILV
jgi:hypothetical protein